jgi:hypothetical protein
VIEDVCCGNLWKCESIYDYWAIALIELNIIRCCRLAITMRQGAVHLKLVLEHLWTGALSRW